MKSFLMTMLLVSGAAAWAQTPLAVPDAGHVLTPPRAMHPGRGAVPPAPPVQTAPVPGGIRFSTVTVSGATVLPAARVAAEFDALRGHDVSADDLRAALNRVDTLFHKSGYPLARAIIPAQRLDDGVLRVKIVEGFISEIAVTANDAATTALVRRMAARLTRQRPLTQQTLEQVILTIQDIPGLTLESRFSTSDLVTGATRLELDATLQPVMVGLSLDNRTAFSRLTVQPYASVTLNNLLGNGDSIKLTTLLSPRPKDYAYYGLSLSQLVNDDGLRAGLDAAWAQALDDVSIRPYDVRSRFAQLAVHARYPLLRAGDESLTLASRVYFTNARYNLAGVARGVIAHDGIVAGEIGADYARSFSPQLGIGGSLKLTQGMVTTSGELHTRLHTIPGFTKLRAEAKAVWSPWENAALKFSAQGQVSPDSLAASEEVSFGGLNYGHGFQAAEISGDKGVGASFQPEYRIVIKDNWSVTPFLLGDYARVWNRRGDGQPSGELVSAGGGARLGLSNFADITLEMDKPLNRTPLDRRDKSWRFYAGAQIGADRLWSLIAGNP